MLKTRIAAAAASSALILSLITPAAFADTNVDISGNGAGSDNDATVVNKDNTTVNQTNNTTIGISISSKANTGGNKASGNTGGDVSIDTGKAVSTVGVSVTGSANAAVLPDCGCAPASTDVTISGNGSDSDNTTTVKNKKKKIVNQTNSTTIGATVTSKAKTGKNKAKNNTGGTVAVTTNDATSEVGIEVTSPANVIGPTL